MTSINTKTLADILHIAATTQQPVSQLSVKHSFDLDISYDIQRELIKRRTDLGKKLVGTKMGFTSKAKMEQMGVHDLIWGLLTEDMAISNGDEVVKSNFIHPRAEPEICFFIGEDIDRELSLEEAPKYVSAVSASIEIIDSRYQNFKFSLEDVVADNCSSAGYVLGDQFPAETNISDLDIKLVINGDTVHQGSSKAIMGNPWESLTNASRLATKYGHVIRKGEILLAGAATPAVYLNTGDSVVAEIEALGKVSFSVKA